MDSIKKVFNEWKSDIPSLDKVVAVIIFIFSILTSGIATICLSFLGGNCRVSQILVGVLQLLLTPLLIGWIWSIYWGFLVYEKSR